MNFFEAGQFWGNTNQTTSFAGITATETVYDYKFVDWHFHENPYFSFVTQGNCRHINKREAFDCSTDSLLFHNCQEPHYNTKTGGISRGFQLELNVDWCKKFGIRLDKLPSSVKIINPNTKLLFYNIYKESKLFDNASPLTIEALLVEIFETVQVVEKNTRSDKPKWVKKIEEILRDSFDQTLSLQELSTELDIHSAHLSRDFSRYFRCNFGEYLRKIRVEKSLSLLRQNELSLTEIAFQCGFADQSHFIRCFKKFNGVTPKTFRKILQ